MSDSINSLKESFLDGKLELHCSTIDLHQLGSSGGKHYSGSGTIRLDLRVDFTGSFIWPGSLPMFAQIMADQQLVSGELIPDSYYYSLRATSVDGTVWRNPKVTVRLSPALTGTVVTFSCDYLATEKPQQSPSPRVAVEMIFLDKLPFPLSGGTRVVRQGLRGEEVSWVQDSAKARTPHADMQYRVWADPIVHSQFTAIFSVPAPPAFETRLIEALRFVSAVPVSWVMLEYVQDGRVRMELAKYREPTNHLVNEPVNGRENSADFFRLLDNFYEYACVHAQKDEFSQLSKAVGPLFAMRGLDMGAISLIIGVAIEAALAEEFADIEEVEQELLEEVSQVSKLIDSVSPIRIKTKKRMQGSLGGLKKRRPLDKLSILHERGHLTSTEINHWKKLRNTAAHGTLHIDPEDWQEHLVRVLSVTTLLYKLAFLRIGYSGAFTDFGSKGWPTAWFPANKEDALVLVKVREELSQAIAVEVTDKLFAWEAVEAALREVFSGEVPVPGEKRVHESLALFRSMIRLARLRLAGLNKKP